jgi:hypothetical protein
MKTNQRELGGPGTVKPVTVTIATFTKMFGIGRTSAYLLINQGLLERVRIGRRTLITVASAEALIAASSTRGVNNSVSKLAPVEEVASGSQPMPPAHFSSHNSSRPNGRKIGHCRL